MQKTSPDSKKKKTVLVIDTHKITREFLTRLIEGLGHSVVLAGSGNDAINLIQAHKKDPFSLIIVEINMWEVDGIDVADFVRHLRLQTPILFTSDGEPKYSYNVLNRITPHMLRKPLTDITVIRTMITRAML